jgi:hypothetical protein
MRLSSYIEPKEYLNDKSRHLNQIFRLAEMLGYPFIGVSLPSLSSIKQQFIALIGCSNPENIEYIGVKQYTRSDFLDFSFQNDTARKFADKMAHHVFVDEFDSAKLFDYINVNQPVNQAVVQALVQSDLFNNIKLGLYLDPFFLVEYFKVAVAFDHIDYLYSANPKKSLTASIPSDIFFAPNLDKKQLKDAVLHLNFKKVDQLLDSKCFSNLTQVCKKTHSLKIKADTVSFGFDPHCLKGIIYHIGRNRINQLSSKIDQRILIILLENLPHCNPESDNYYIQNAINRVQYLDRKLDEIQIHDNNFSEFFILNYALQFNKALSSISNTNVDLHLCQFTMDMYGRLVPTFGISDSLNYFNRVVLFEKDCKVDDYQTMLNMVHNKILKCILSSNSPNSTLNVMLTQHINAIIAADQTLA